MNPTTPQLAQAPYPASARPVVPPRRGSVGPDRPTWGELLFATASLTDAPAFYGPPVIFVLGPWLLLALLLIGPFALILTLALTLVVAAGLLAVFAAVIASPYLLIRHLHSRGMVHAKRSGPLHVFHHHRASSGRLGSLQPKGMS